jgi:hypothetical protein
MLVSHQLVLMLMLRLQQLVQLLQHYPYHVEALLALSELVGYTGAPEGLLDPQTSIYYGTAYLASQWIRYRLSSRQLTDAIASLLKSEPVFAYEYEGVRYDCGSKLGYLKASVEFALRHPEVKTEFAAYLKSRSLT